MKTPEEAKKLKFQLRESDLEILKNCINKIQHIIETKNINEQVVFDICSITNDLNSMQETFFWRLINLSKQNYRID
jgi:hypothetical protein